MQLEDQALAALRRGQLHCDSLFLEPHAVDHNLVGAGGWPQFEAPIGGSRRAAAGQGLVEPDVDEGANEGLGKRLPGFPVHDPSGDDRVRFQVEAQMAALAKLDALPVGRAGSNSDHGDVDARL